jgi:hypothetical protein
MTWTKDEIFNFNEAEAAAGQGKWEKANYYLLMNVLGRLYNAKEKRSWSLRLPEDSLPALSAVRSYTGGRWGNDIKKANGNWSKKYESLSWLWQGPKQGKKKGRGLRQSKYLR